MFRAALRTKFPTGARPEDARGFFFSVVTTNRTRNHANPRPFLNLVWSEHRAWIGVNIAHGEAPDGGTTRGLSGSTGEPVTEGSNRHR